MLKFKHINFIVLWHFVEKLVANPQEQELKWGGKSHKLPSSMELFQILSDSKSYSVSCLMW